MREKRKKSRYKIITAKYRNVTKIFDSTCIYVENMKKYVRNMKKNPRIGERKREGERKNEEICGFPSQTRVSTRALHFNFLPALNMWNI